MDRGQRQKIIDDFIIMFPDTLDDKFIYRNDRDCIEWICSHGVGHPIWDAHNNFVHGCDNCCKRFKGWRDK